MLPACAKFKDEKKAAIYFEILMILSEETPSFIWLDQHSDCQKIYPHLHDLCQNFRFNLTT